MIVVVVVFSACVSSTLGVVENSKDYSAKQGKFNKYKQQPTWIHKIPKETDTHIYFIGSYQPSISQYPAGATINDSKLNAVQDAQKQVAYYISSKIKSEYQEQISEYKKSTELSINDIKIKKLEQSLVEEEVTMELWSSTSASFTGLVKHEEYWERHEGKTKQKDRENYYHCWILYSIPKSEIEKSRDEIKKRENIEIKEEYLYNIWRNDVNKIISQLKDINFDSEKQSLYMDKYSLLLDLASNLKGLISFKNMTDDNPKKSDYKELVINIENIIISYDPTDKLKQRYESKIRELSKNTNILQNKILELEDENKQLKINHGGVIKNLEHKIELISHEQEVREKTLEEYTKNIQKEIMSLRDQGITLQSQITYTFYPIKPEMIKISNKFFITENFVFNKDYSSYLFFNNIKNAYRNNINILAPITKISWIDAIKYCNWLSRLYDLEECYNITEENIYIDTSKNGYRLPTKSELEVFLITKKTIQREDKNYSDIAEWVFDLFDNKLNRTIIRFLDNKIETAGLEQDKVSDYISFRLVRSVLE